VSVLFKLMFQAMFLHTSNDITPDCFEFDVCKHDNDHMDNGCVVDMPEISTLVMFERLFLHTPDKYAASTGCFHVIINIINRELAAVRQPY
jgi:hypothetical protein